MSIRAKVSLPKFQVFRRVTFGSDSGREEECSVSSLGSNSSIVCNPRVRSSPSFSINFACRVRLSSISSVVVASAFRPGRFPLNPNRYLERGGLLDELIRSPLPYLPRCRIWALNYRLSPQRGRFRTRICQSASPVPTVAYGVSGKLERSTMVNYVLCQNFVDS